MNLQHCRGIGQFGPAYEVMLRNDTHSPGSVDRALLEEMVRLCPETAGVLYGEFTPTEVRYQRGSLPELEQYVAQATAGARDVEERVNAIVRFTAKLGDRAPAQLEAMVVGGTEEEIIARGSDWCTDVARVACALCQVAGIPARLVFLANPEQPYSGHDIVEAYRQGVWGAADAVTGLVYHDALGKPVSTWQLMCSPELIRINNPTGRIPFAEPGQFTAACIANYFVWERGKYTYTTSRLNSYYRSILEMAERGWPGGLRWLHGEDALAGGVTDRQPG